MGAVLRSARHRRRRRAAAAGPAQMIETVALCEILSAAKIVADKDTLAQLARRLNELGQQYRHIRFARTSHARRKELLDDLVRVAEAAASASGVLDADLGGLCEIESLLGAFHCDVAAQTQLLHRLHDAADQAIRVLETAHPRISANGEEPETWLFVQLYDLYKLLSGRKEISPGGPLDRFARKASALISRDIVVPAADSFYHRLRAALKRRKE
jgi:hypothetical protein